MDYEKKYKEALETARKINSGEGVAAPPDWTSYEVIFPELKESKDEKIRKELIEHIKSNCEARFLLFQKFSPDDVIAWLEKQRTSNEAIKYLEENHSPSEISDFQAAMNIAVAKAYDKGKRDAEKQGEEKNKINITFEDVLVLECAMKTIKITEGGNELYEKLVLLYNKIHNAYLVEKQGEQKPFDYENVTIVPQDFAPKENTPRYNIGDVLCDKLCTTLNKDTQYNLEIVDIRNGMYICDNGSFPISQQDEYELVAKKIEQNPADRFEPKFQQGQWIVWQNKCYKVNDNGCGYELIDQNGLSKRLEYGTVDESAHVWTIADAKDGDVLYSLDSKRPFIYKDRLQFSQARGYCCINKFGEFAVWYTSKCVICTDKYIPATKEQRDQLEKAMADAGYTFDFEKKELKKIEQHLAWSEEDDAYKLFTISAVKDYYDEKNPLQKNLVEWLKSLKERIE